MGRTWRETIKVKSREGGEFDCYLARPAATKEPVPAIVLASAIHGVDEDLRALADLFASHGVLAAAPDLFWRTVPGPLPRSDARARERIQPREEKIKIGEADMADTLAMLQGLPDFNGRAAAIGFCFGGPYAIIGPKRLGYAAGIACHGTNLIAYIDALEGLSAPLCIVWGDEDHAAPPEVLDGLSRGRGAHGECRGARLPRRQARLHDADGGRRVRCQDAGILDCARARHSRRPTRRWRAPAARLLGPWRRPPQSDSRRSTALTG